MVAKQQRMNAGVSSQMAKPNKMSKGVTYGALSDAEKNRLKNNGKTDKLCCIQQKIEPDTPKEIYQNKGRGTT